MKAFPIYTFVTVFCCVALLLSCNDVDYLNVEQSFINTRISESQLKDESSFVSVEEAKDIANLFFYKQAFANPLSRNDGNKEIDGTPIKVLDEDGSPLMYILNYKNGGFVIISATKDYYPVLAFSDKGSFVLSDQVNGVSIWLNDTKKQIKNSISLNDSIKTKIYAVWNSYESFDNSLIKSRTMDDSSTPEAIQACWNRCYELEAQYSTEGWLFAPLQYVEQVFAGAGYSSTYEDLCFSANFNHSPLDCSIVGWRLGTLREEVGPWLSTQWHQNTPFNDLCDGNPAGCAAVAVAQVMKYYEHPQNLSLNGYSFSWNTIPNDPDPTSDQAKLLKLVGTFIGTKYGLVGSWTTPSNLVDGLNSLMYNVQKEDYYPYETERYLFDHQKPIIMLGNDTNLSWIPGQGNIEYAGKSHYWVCDGAKHIIPNNLEYFTEWQPYGNGTFVKGWNTIDNPGVLRGVVTTYFSMNWGWSQNDPNDENGKNGWYIDANSGSGNYEHSRVNFYLSKK